MANDPAWFYKSFWISEGKVAFLEIIGDFDEDGMMTFNTHMRDEYLENGEAPVHCIIDANGLSSYPQNIRVLRKGTKISVDHPNTGWIILVGFEGPLLRFFSSTIAQILGIEFKQVPTLDDAIQVLKRVDSRLVDMRYDERH